MPGATVDNAFGDDTNVYRIAHKIFALVNVEAGNYITMDCDLCHDEPE